MSARIVSAALLLILAGCTPSPADQVIAADCGVQTGMSGDLATDIVGSWRWSWSGSADSGPTSILLDFAADGTATTTDRATGHEKWVYHIVDDEVRMTGVDPGDDLQSLRTIWIFDGTGWNVAANEAYGQSTLEHCD
jgi:hypothetical protein